MAMTELTPELRTQWAEARVKIPVNRLYKHYKGGSYIVVDLAHDCETCEPVVVYQNLDLGATWTRNASAWLEPVYAYNEEGQCCGEQIRFTLQGIK